MAIDKGPTVQQRAIVQLITLATEGRVTTYEDLAFALGTPTTGNALGGTLGPILGDVFHWCVRTKLPMLTSLVVRKSGADEGMPGRGFWELAQTLEPGSQFPFFPEGQLADAPRKTRKVYTDLQHLQCYTFFQPLTQMDLSKALPSALHMAEVHAAAPGNTGIMRQRAERSLDDKRRIDATEFNIAIVDRMTTHGQVSSVFPVGTFRKYEIDEVKMSNVHLRQSNLGSQRPSVVITLTNNGMFNLIMSLAHCAEVMGGWENLDSIVNFAGQAEGEYKILFDRYRSVFKMAPDDKVATYLRNLDEDMQARLHNVPAHIWGAMFLLS